MTCHNVLESGLVQFKSPYINTEDLILWRNISGQSLQGDSISFEYIIGAREQTKE
jgi:hypothetical protein